MIVSKIIVELKTVYFSILVEKSIYLIYNTPVSYTHLDVYQRQVVTHSVLLLTLLVTGSNNMLHLAPFCQDAT